MAGIEKIYGTQMQWAELRQWLYKNKPELLTHVIDKFRGEGFSIALFPAAYDRWLIKNCPLEWLIDQILDQYGIE